MKETLYTAGKKIHTYIGDTGQVTTDLLAVTHRFTVTVTIVTIAVLCVGDMGYVATDKLGSQSLL